MYTKCVVLGTCSAMESTNKFFMYTTLRTVHEFNPQFWGRKSKCLLCSSFKYFFSIHVNIHPYIYYKTVCQETIVKNGNNLYCRQYYIVKYFQWFIDKSYKLLPGYTHTIYSFWFRRWGGRGQTLMAQMY